MKVLTEIRNEYYNRIGEIPDDSRKRSNVEIRAALTNALAPLCHLRDIVVLFKRDRTSAYHYLRNHETYYHHSREYRMWFSVATDVVNEKINKVPASQLSERAQFKINIHEQIDSVNSTIKTLEGFRKNLRTALRRGQSFSLQDLPQRGVSDDARNLGGPDVYSVLSNEQLQVQDESGEEGRATTGAGHQEGTVVRDTSKRVTT